MTCLTTPRPKRLRTRYEALEVLRACETSETNWQKRLKENESERQQILVILNESEAEHAAIVQEIQTLREVQAYERDCLIERLRGEMVRPTYRSDRTGGCTEISEEWLEYSGHRRDQVMGYAWQSLIHPDDAPATIGAYMQCIADQTPHTTEYRIQKNDRSWMRHRVVCEPQFSSSGLFIGMNGWLAAV